MEQTEERNFLLPETEKQIDENSKKVSHGTTNPDSEQITSKALRVKRQGEDYTPAEDGDVFTDTETTDDDMTQPIATITSAATTVTTTKLTTKALAAVCIILTKSFC